MWKIAIFGSRRTATTALPGVGKTAASQEASQRALREENARLKSDLARTEQLLQDRTRQLGRINVEAIRQEALIEMVRGLVEPLEDVQRAMGAVNIPPIVQQQTVWWRGMVAAHNKFMRALKAEGVSTFGGLHEQFDPERHFAVDLQYRQDVAEDTIIAVYQPGYKFRGVLITPAMVSVATLSIEKTA